MSVKGSCWQIKDSLRHTNLIPSIRDRPGMNTTYLWLGLLNAIVFFRLITSFQVPLLRHSNPPRIVSAVENPHRQARGGEGQTYLTGG